MKDDRMDRRTHCLLVSLLVCNLLLPVLLVADETTLELGRVGEGPTVVELKAGESRELTCWFPSGFSRITLPLTGGIQMNMEDRKHVAFLKRRSPMGLKELPLLGLRYGQRTLSVIIPWPHYAHFVVKDRVGVRFSFPKERNNTTPCQLVLQWTDNQLLSIARAFRQWRSGSDDLGAIPEVRTLAAKSESLPQVKQLYGAGHFYLWGPAGFSRHDVPRRQWVRFAKAIQNAPKGSFGSRLKSSFSSDQLEALSALAKAEWPMNYLTVAVAGAIDRALFRLESRPGVDGGARDRVATNRSAMVREFGSYLNKESTWGDGLSESLLNELKEAGIDRAVLVLSDLYRQAVRPDAVAKATALGFPIGPYDSYHSVHSPDALPDDTWETAQFDRMAFEEGRVVKEAGRRQGGFKGRGFHFSPQAAWPYFQKRIRSVRGRNDYTAWFVDCDATGECFDDYHPSHPATQVDDMQQRRQRLQWLENSERQLVGSEGGSILFADVIHFGHGVHTPYIGHLDPAFRDRESPHFLGRHWPPDTPEQSFKAVPLPESLRSPYFDPSVRIPLYQAVLGDELVVSHHWSFDSLKLSDLVETRALLEILYAVPPMYHLNRESWAKRKDSIVKHLSFWAPLHRTVATLPLTRFERLSQDGLVQRTHFGNGPTPVKVTANFSSRAQSGLPPMSAQVDGVAELNGRIYRP